MFISDIQHSDSTIVCIFFFKCLKRKGFARPDDSEARKSLLTDRQSPWGTSLRCSLSG